MKNIDVTKEAYGIVIQVSDTGHIILYKHPDILKYIVSNTDSGAVNAQQVILGSTINTNDELDKLLEINNDAKASNATESSVTDDGITIAVPYIFKTKSEAEVALNDLNVKQKMYKDSLLNDLKENLISTNLKIINIYDLYKTTPTSN